MKSKTNMAKDQVRAKKHLGQHFLRDQNIAKKIVNSLTGVYPEGDVLEIGPGMGVLTQYLQEVPALRTRAVEIDQESVAYLNEKWPALEVVQNDFLKLNWLDVFDGKFAVIGNFPYNISSQIFFKILEDRNHVPVVVGMIQKEVAQRIAAPHGNKTYGILSVLLQTFYKIEYLFTVHEHVFSPPPAVKSAVVRLQRNERTYLPCDEKLFFQVVKQGFNNRRKTLRNALKVLNLPEAVQQDPLLNKRAEQLDVATFIALTEKIEKASSCR